MKEKVMLILKFFAFLLSIPCVVATTNAFVGQLMVIPDVMRFFLMWGIITYLVIHVFVAELSGIFTFGQRITSGLFRFFPGFSNLAGHLFPIYSILILVAFYVTSFIFKRGEFGRYFIFFLGFSMVLHFIFSARDLKEADKNAAKPTYLITMAWVYIVNIFIVSLFLDLIFKSFSFTEFLKSFGQTAGYLYWGIFKQLFLS